MVPVDPETLFLDLQEDLVDAVPGFDPVPSPFMSRSRYAAAALAKSFLKKFEDIPADAADAAAIEDFLHTNGAVGSWTLKLESTLDELLVGEFCQLVHQFVEPGNRFPLFSTFEAILDRARMGPGSSIGAEGEDFYTKLFSSPLTCTSEGLYLAYANYVSQSGTWANAELHRVQRYGEARIVAGNRLSCVPKNVDISRTICTEPSLNMFYQLGVGDLLVDRLKSFFGIDLADQQARNRDLARVGSLDFKVNRNPPEDGLVTIDLSKASDSIGLRMLEKLVPRDFVAWLKLLRCKETTLPNGSKVQLNMVSTMGNGYTFPLQTMLFCCVVEACHRVFEYPAERGSWGVNGDDIICGKYVARGVVRLLTLLGFTVNATKSFLEGPFRESCGADFHLGQPVRGVYVKTLKTTQARYAVINQLNLWQVRQGLILPRTTKRLINSVEYLPVPLWENDDAGIRVPYRLIKGLRKHKELQSVLYRRWVPRERVIRIGESGIASYPRYARHRDYNPHGLLIAFLNGSIERGMISLRQREVRYQTRTGVAPNWDSCPADVNLEHTSARERLCAVLEAAR
jgi:hypothetical protein